MTGSREKRGSQLTSDSDVDLSTSTMFDTTPQDPSDPPRPTSGCAAKATERGAVSVKCTSEFHKAFSNWFQALKERCSRPCEYLKMLRPHLTCLWPLCRPLQDVLLWTTAETRSTWLDVLLRPAWSNPANGISFKV